MTTSIEESPYTVEQAIDLALLLMEEHGLLADGWVFGLNGAVRAVGTCNFKKRKIMLSRYWIEAAPSAETRDTILHEIAHALAGSRANHGPAWRAVARRIGARPQACTSIAVELEKKPSWEGTCPRCGTVYGYYRAPSRVNACGAHSSGFNPDHVLAWTKNGKKVPMGAKFMAEVARLEEKYDRKISY